MTEEEDQLSECEQVIARFNALPVATLSKTIASDLDTIRLLVPDHDVSVHTSSTLSDSQISDCVALVRSNLRHFYVSSSWGWSESRKLEEMTDVHQRFILITSRTTHTSSSLQVQGQAQDQVQDQVQGQAQEQVQGQVHGYVSFQLVDEDGPCLYCYELQLAPTLRSRGLGRVLMHAMEQMAMKQGIGKVKLTVFTANEAAVTFYMRLGYERDPTSPEPVKIRQTRSGTRKVTSDYMIMSKQLS